MEVKVVIEKDEATIPGSKYQSLKNAGVQVRLAANLAPAVGAGMLSHVALDLLTHSDVPLFAPFIVRRYGLGLTHVGSPYSPYSC